ncbi:MAG: MGMT family protein [Pseudomonadota bacterium]|jgi:methylated-DNA-protein-cysteine methyltransferase-like protein|nr:cysteine methyltransferase [Alteromonas sp.]MDY6927078.1 MGMT family protein [Pseudomonadota bacterium]|tara:strand:+ start:56 stop:430 length:375 start_codon:yes stop_codon:yes gene_type:complete
MTKQTSADTGRYKLTPAERIWHTVGLIPEANVASYGKIADLAGLPGRARFVGYCLRNVPASLKLPWHRVLRSNGQIAFQAGTPQALTQCELLADEQVLVQNNRVNLKLYGWEPALDVLLHQLAF